MFIIISPPYVNIVLDAFSVIQYRTSLRKQPISRDTTTGFPAKWRLGNEHRNSILSLMTCHYPDLGTASDWSCRLWNLLQPIRSITQIWVVTRHQYGISALVSSSQTSFRGETVRGIAKCRHFSQADIVPLEIIVHWFPARNSFPLS